MAGIIDTIKLAGVLVLALPAALAGLEFLLVRGETTVGAILLGLAVALVVIEQRLTTPSDLPGLAAKRVVGTVASDSESDSDADDETTTVRADDR
ncbi:DUF7533 family protein [Natronorubrum thiooxidans]|uniref:Uncharacterized protein n=1 Tax=Natronorubrum thiooxidans TaxID=308853 RepID=A0A1N7CUJ5_9EURY|nr:hypothetical protein [Natronorubrum thiooxidans]SIR67243.1 hypothetical protein SAMN05421752_101587 [Natronorubrum thiooxidans]